MSGNKAHWSHTIELRATPVSASQARTFVSRHLAEHRLVELDDAVRLVASELATNALVHAQTAFSVTLAAADGTVVLTVGDASSALPERRAAHVLHASGRGLEIVDAVSSNWGVTENETGSKAVWARFATA